VLPDGSITEEQLPTCTWDCECPDGVVCIEGRCDLRDRSSVVSSRPFDEVVERLTTTIDLGEMSFRT
jgi:hypothetical protein